MSYRKLTAIMQKSKNKHAIKEILESRSCCLQCPFNGKPKGKYPITNELCEKYHRYLETERVYGQLLYKFEGERSFINKCKFFPRIKKSKNKQNKRRRYK